MTFSKDTNMLKVAKKELKYVINNRYLGNLHQDVDLDIFENLIKYTEKIKKELDERENIEKELSVDSTTIFKALKNGIWLENIYGEIINLKCYLIYHPKGWILRIADGYVPPKDHLKKWWLFEELSEEQKSRMNDMFKDYKEE
jgi:hypothetical protein